MSTSIRPTPDLRMIPLGLFSVGIGLFLTGGLFLGAIPDGGPFIAFGLITAGLGALITGFWAFRADNVFGGVAQSVVGMVFASFATYDWFFYASAKNNGVDHAWMFAASAIVIGLIAIASFKANIPRLASATLILLFLFLAFEWAGFAFHSPVLMQIGGAIAILTAIFAWIGGLMRLLMSL